MSQWHRNARYSLKHVVGAAGAAVVMVILGAGTGVGQGVASASPKVTTGNVATYALSVGETFTWILPLENQNAYEDWDSNIEGSMWLPLYFAGIGSKPGIDYHLSIGKKPVYSDQDKTVTVTMNPGFTWSTGAKVTSADVKFFFELLDAGKTKLGNYIPGEMPDDIASVTYPSPTQFVIHLKRSYNPAWFTGNQLTWIYPLPAQAWDRTSATGPVGTDASTAAGAKAVFNFLFKQSQDRHTYTTNPLWKVVDGPWVITSFDPVTFAASFSANSHYTGPTKPRLAGYKVRSFTTGTAELNALRSGSITFGTLPLSDLSEASYFKSHGYTVKPWRVFYNEDMELGYTSKTWGPLVKQLYIRQALQHVVTEHLYITKALHGYGLPDYGPAPDYPGSKYVSPTLRKDPYPYSISAAQKLLTDHGWSPGSDGIDVCKHPGTGSGKCGKGIAKGKKLSFSFMYSTGTTAFLAEVSAFQTAAKKAGIGITLNGQTENTMFSIGGTCPASPPCNWGILGYGAFMWDFGQYELIPAGGNQFGKGNYWSGGYYTAKATRLIQAAHEKPGLKYLYADENYLSKNVAALWWPVADYQVVVAKKSLQGWQNLSPYANFNPQAWYFSS